jgi:hypothetical protein
MPVYATGADRFAVATAGGIGSQANVVGLMQSVSTAFLFAGNVQTDGVLTAAAVQWQAITTGGAGLTVGSVFYLDPTTPGNITSTVPSTSGQYVVTIGTALSTTQLDIQIQPSVLLGTVVNPSTLQPVLPVIASSLNLWVATTGNDTTGNGTSGTPWASLAKAISYLNGYAIAPAALVTIYIGDGNYASSSININHQNGDRIAIQGMNVYSTTLSGSITSFTTPSGGSATAVINVTSSANMAINDYILILNASGGSHGWLLNGCHQITNIVGNALTITVKSYSANTASGAISGTVTCVKTRLTFASGSGIALSNGGLQFSLGLISQLILVGNTGGMGISCGKFNVPSSNPYLGIVGWQSGIFGQQGANFFAGSIAISGCSSCGIQANFSTMVSVSGTVINGCPIGLYLSYCTSAYASGIIVVGCTTGVQVQFSSSINGPASVYESTGIGIGLTYESTALLNGASTVISYCGTGVNVAGGCITNVAGCLITNCTVGVSTNYLSCTIGCGSVTFTGTTTPYTPSPLNTLGNNGSYNFT